MNEYENLSIKEIDNALFSLPIALSSHIISQTDAEKIRYKLMTAKEKKILETYPLRIWNAKDPKTNADVCRAYVPDSTKPKNRRLIQAKDREHLDKKLLDDYSKNMDERLVFANYFANWLITYKSNLVKPDTLQRNLDDYRKFIQGSKLDSMKITDIKRIDIKNLLNATINTHHLTSKALGNLKSIFNGLFAYAFDAEDIVVNPMIYMKIDNTNIKPEKVKQAVTEVFNEEELDKITEYMYKHYMEYNPVVTLAILFNFQLGLRVSELCAIKITDLDFEHRTIAIQRMERSYRPIELVDGKIVKQKTVHIIVEGETKRNSNRVIDLSDEAILIAQEALRVQKDLSIKSDFLFAAENGEHIYRQRINDCLRYYCNQILIAAKSSHKQRKTVLSNLFSQGFDLDEVMQIAGHRQKETCLKYYIFSMRLKDNRQKRMSDALASKHCTLGQPPLNPR